MIYRAKRNNNYTVISNAGPNDPRLSLRAKGLLVYILTKPDGWNVSERQLASIGPDGRDAVRTALKELESCGYLIRRRSKRADGTFEWHSTIFDEPRVPQETQESVEDSPWPDCPVMDNPAERPTMCADSPVMVNPIISDNSPEKPVADLPCLVQPTLVEPTLVEPTVINTIGVKRNTPAKREQPSQQRSVRKSEGYVNPGTGISTNAILAAYVDALCVYEPNGVINYGEAGRAAKQIAELGYTPEDVVFVVGRLKADAFWRTRHLSLNSAAKQMSALLRQRDSFVAEESPRKRMKVYE